MQGNAADGGFKVKMVEGNMTHIKSDVTRYDNTVGTFTDGQLLGLALQRRNAS